MAPKINGKPAVKPKPRGFAAIAPELQAKFCKRGGKSTAKKYGRAHMSRIGKRGRAKRTRAEKAAKAKKGWFLI